MQWHRKPVEVVTTTLRPTTAAALSEARELIVRPKFRRAIAAAVLFVGAAAVTVALGGIHATHSVVVNGAKTTQAYDSHRFGSWISIVLCFLFGVAMVRLIANEIARLARLRGSPAAANSLRVVIQIIGYLVVFVVLLGLLAVRVQSVLLSGAIGSVVIGLAAQQSLGNAFAGIVLLISRPFVVGDYITFRSGGLGGQYDGEVTGITLMFTTLQTTDGPINFPNSAVLSAAATGRRSKPQNSSPGGELLR
ncbi:MAG TPA: mechanosensitive ion channel family protein [Acidothermaceae bacterium]|nr:mechanosensitive ion channel family protein [Acidothermaceae bacterium]